MKKITTRSFEQLLSEELQKRKRNYSETYKQKLIKKAKAAFTGATGSDIKNVYFCFDDFSSAVRISVGKINLVYQIGGLYYLIPKYDISNLFF